MSAGNGFIHCSQGTQIVSSAIYKKQITQSIQEGIVCLSTIHLCSMNMEPLLSKPYVNEVTLREENDP